MKSLHQARVATRRLRAALVLGSGRKAEKVARSVRRLTRLLGPARELDVLRLLVQRQTDKEIAATLFVSHRTVMSHVANILGKLGVANRREAAAAAVELGLA